MSEIEVKLEQEVTAEMQKKKLQEIFVQLDAALDEAIKHGHGFLIVNRDGQVKHVHYSVAYMTAKASMELVV